MKEFINKYINNNLSKEIKIKLENNPQFMLSLISFTHDKTYYFNCSDNVKLNYEFIRALIFMFQIDKTFIFYISDYYLHNGSDFFNCFELHIILSNIIGETNDLEEQEYLNTLNNYYELIKVKLLMNQEENDYQGLGFIYLENKFFNRKLILNYFARQFLKEIFYNNISYSLFTIKDLFLKSKKNLRNFLIDFITKYDTELAWYVSNNIFLLMEIEDVLLPSENNKILYLKNDIDFK